MKFFINSEYGELHDLAIHLQDIEKQEVVLSIPNHDYEKIGDGIIKNKDTKWWNYLGKGYVFVFDGCSAGNLEDWLRSKGELVVNGTEKGDKLENDRQLAQKWFKNAGFYQPVSRNFTDFNSAIQFVKQFKGNLILKQNGDAPKSLNHTGKYGGMDMLYHLDQLKKSWNESDYGKVDFDLMEVVEGLEVSASAFFNGNEFLKNKAGKVVGFLNFEEKKESNDQMGETTGETGTTFIGVDETNAIFKDILLRPKILEVLKALKFKGVFDINGMRTSKGYVAFEPTCRFGIPATSYEFMEGLLSPTSELLYNLAKGENKPVEIRMGVGMVIVVSAKPYPVEASLDAKDTSLGEKLWILKNGKPVENFDPEQLKHIHLQNFEKRDKDYLVATKNGYLLVCSGYGKTIKETRENLIKYIKDSIYISGMKIRTDIGARVEKFI